MAVRKLNPLMFLPVDRAMTELGKNISLARRKRRLTQQQMADRTNVSIATYRRIEKGDGSVAAATLGRVIYALGDLPYCQKILDPYRDYQGLENLEDHLPKRVRHTEQEKS